MASTDLTAHRLRHILCYDPNTGVFTWRINKSARRARTVAGSQSHGGYTDIRVDGRTWKAHRLAWLYMTGEWPTHEIDHINRNRGDTRWANLRQATHAENHQNLPLRKDSQNPFRGIETHRCGLWRARISVKGKRFHLGYFKTPEDARQARIEAERVHFTHSDVCEPQFACHGELDQPDEIASQRQLFQ